jgi:phosphohistidine phosphatase
MEVYLVQHGRALPKDTDPARPLSQEGRADVRSIAAALGRNIRVERLIHSAKERARQTAEILMTMPGCSAAPEESGGLSPKDSVEPWAERLAEAEESTMLVGHLPFMGRLASVLLGDEPTMERVRFTPGTVLGLSRTDDGWRLELLIRPEQLGGV